ncbi:hypothetical protein K2173_011319 [Erythroxylum novogranatense]|uniref:DNA topoisomerase 2 n=1 Tax=Erythroxylum novogranatense TaxID=1862640 RepID=A0AAV8S9G9_9ROSI|nr:hypothetical protein K2173_011319 [Erythroxylum novogranatense]
MVASKGFPLKTSNNANVESNAGPGKSIEEIYQKKSQLEHILLRPDTYVGSIEKHTQNLWVYDGDKMVQRSVTYVPGLYKIFDEILVNAADNKQRDPSMSQVKVLIDVENNLISVYNNGDGVPVEIHKEEGVYVPELIFGHLLTSSNYDDTVKKTTGGRNGYGAKLTNIFSTEFVIETADGKRQKKYKQVFTNNMGKKSEPAITKCKETENWTKVSFKPDLAKFNMTHLEDDVVALMKKRVVDVAGCLGKTVKVELNGKLVPVKSFQDYVNLYLNSVSDSGSDRPQSFYQKVNDRWEVCVSVSEGQFQQVSFVNGIATIKGGTHVDYVTNQITNHLVAFVNKKHKKANIKPHNARNYLWVFVNALIDNPAFDSQTKETLTLRQSSFGSTCDLSDDLLKKVANSDVVKHLLTWAQFKEEKELKKTDGSKKGRVNIPKLEDANEAGGKNSHNCTLILTEGDSAKSLAMAGIAALSVKDRDLYGVFPLRGKLLNVREANSKQINDNKEIEAIKKILGLQQGKQYDNATIKSLRYGRLMIMTDQDHDGSHIKGLLINFIHKFWPSLLKVQSFMVEFITPIVKAKRGGETISFYSMPEYESWKESLRGNAKGWTIKYYKGLGTSVSAEGKEYFRNLDRHKKDFKWEDDQDGDCIELAFSKKRIESRKNWLRQYEPGTYLDSREKVIKYSDFINKELILFSMADLQRSIPSMVDGFKPGQRKILFCAFKRNLIKQMKVAQFTGYVGEKSAYHHGEQNLAGTIIGMAQNFVGSNNINLLQPEGQFGTRNSGGKDHASARYIFTCLCPVTRVLFPKDDDNLLNYLKDDGLSIEPSWYIPIIPMVLVNGCEGIGTGWSTFIPNYNARDIVANLRRLLNDEMLEPMHPWYRGFKGTIEQVALKVAGVSYAVNGAVEEVNETTIRITELPIRRWTDDYTEFLNSITEGSKDEKGKPKDFTIKEFRKYSDEQNVVFEIVLSEENIAKAKEEGLLKKFKLTATISTSNMHLFDPSGKLKKYDTPEQILEEFFDLRLEYYEKRKRVLLESLQTELVKLENKARFIFAVVNGEIIVNNRKKADLFLELQQKGFTPFPKKGKPVEALVAGASDDSEETDETSETVVTEVIQGSDYDYLLSMPIGTLTLEKAQQLYDERDKASEEVERMRKLTPRDMWLNELDAVEKELDAIEKCEDAKAEMARKKLMSELNGETVGKRQATKAPRKYNKKATNPETTADPSAITESVEPLESNLGLVKPKARAAPKKAPTRKEKLTPVSDDDEDDEVESLKERLKAYKLDSSPDQLAAMETDAPVEKQQPKRGGAAKKKAQATVTVLSDSDDDFEVVELAEKKKGGGIKGAKPPAATKKRGPANKKQPGQKLLTEMLKPSETEGISPEKKVRKMRPSPFNKKSSSILGGTGKDGVATINQELSGSGSSSPTEESTELPARARPTRASRKQTRYVLSDSDNDDDKASEDSEFESESDHNTDDSDFGEDED